MKEMITKNKNQVLLHFLFIGLFSFFSMGLRGTNAPITKLGNISNALPGKQVTVPVKVSNFENIGGITLALEYDYSKIQFISGTKNPDLVGMCYIGDYDIGNGFHRLTISWFKSGEGLSFVDGTSIVDYVFNYTSGPASLTWFEIGPSCIYNDPDANTLNDTPTAVYYYNGVISNAPIIQAKIETNSVGDIQKNSAKCSGDITSLGYPNPKTHGFCWSTEENPTLADSFSIEGEATIAGSFSSALTGLIPGTTYFVCAYATDFRDETIYGEPMSFTTHIDAEVAPTEISKITDTDAELKSKLLTLGIPNAITHGICWSTDTLPSINDNITDMGEAVSTDEFTTELIGLIPLTKYYVRAYATSNSGETVYGDVLSFTTLDIATVANNEVSKITDTSATVNSSLIASNNQNVLAYGICWGTENEPTLAQSSQEGLADSLGVFISELSGLDAGTTYYVRAYVTNSIGTTYSNAISFVSYAFPDVVTVEVSNITENTAILKGDLLDLGVPAASDFGVCWSTNNNPTVTDFVTDKGVDPVTGEFSSELTNLLPDTKYYARSFANNDLGVVYGEVVSFTSLKVVGVSNLEYSNLKVFAYENEIVVLANESLKADLTVYNRIGKQVLREQMIGDEKRISFNQKGIFIVKINSDSNSISRRIVF